MANHTIRQSINQTIDHCMGQAISTGVFPGAVLLCSKDGNIVFHEAYGMADIFEPRQMQKNSVFDLASLTKPLATTLAVSRLVETGQLFLDQRVGEILTEFANTEKAHITVDSLLRHSSGFPAHREYFKQMREVNKDPRDFLRQLLVKEPLEYKTGDRQVYSDLGFMVLSWIIEKTSGRRLDKFVYEQIYSPLGIEDLFFLPLGVDTGTSVPSRKLCAATQACPWRKRVLKGEVDDDNAWAAGGIEGHAGLFGTAGAVHDLCREIMNAVQNRPAKILDPDIIREMASRKNQYEMTAGFDTPAKKNSSSGRYFSAASLGHLGFTGTSFWMDPKNSFMVIFLTNRVHPSRSNMGIKEFRPRLHDLLYAQLS